jgi:hypothetical protein
MDWINLAQDRDKWKAFVYKFHKTLGNSWIAERLAAYQEGLSSLELVTRSINDLSAVTPETAALA